MKDMRVFLRVLIVCTLLFIVAFTSASEVLYRVHSVMGQVKIQNGSQWVAVKKNSQISSSATLSIVKGSSVSIIDPVSKRVYTIDKEGTGFVARLIIDAKNNAERTISSVNRQIANSISHSEDKVGSHYNNIGVAFRGDEADSIAEIPFERFVELLNDRDLHFDSISLMPVIENDVIHFIIVNDADRPFWFNALIFDTVNEARLLWPFSYDMETSSILVDKLSERELSEYQFDVNELIGKKIVLIGSQQPLSLSHTQEGINVGVDFDRNTNDAQTKDFFIKTHVITKE